MQGMRTAVASMLAVALGLMVAPELQARDLKVTRLCEGPILTGDAFLAAGASEEEGANLNGPTLVRVPDWLDPERRADPRARYYLYFAHHKGAYIRLAWASELCGPWHLYRVGDDVGLERRGVLDIGPARELDVGNGLEISGHVASPEVVVDDANRRFILTFHGPTTHRGTPLIGQKTFVATSADGLDFNGGVRPVVLGNSYFRVFRHRGQLYAIANSGTLYEAPDPGHPWTPPDGFEFSHELWRMRCAPLIWVEPSPLGTPMLPRHSWVQPGGDELEVFYTRVGDVPERIVVMTVDASSADFDAWAPVLPARELLRAELPWEGAGIEPAPSAFDWAPERVNQLRDPFVFTDADGSRYLLYTGAGEDAIGLAELSRGQ